MDKADARRLKALVSTIPRVKTQFYHQISRLHGSGQVVFPGLSFFTSNLEIITFMLQTYSEDPKNLIQ